MNLNIAIVSRAVEAARTQRADRVMVTMNSFTYGYWHAELTAYQRLDGHVKFNEDPRIPSGSIETQNVERKPPGPRVVHDCREKVRAAG